MEEKEEADKIELYSDASDNVYFNVDKHCEKDKICVGAVFPWKDPLYYDKDKKYPAGYLIGYCIIVADYHPNYEMYCVLSVVVDHVGEIAAAGPATLGGGVANTFLITAASGDYKGKEGSVIGYPSLRTLATSCTPLCSIRPLC